jgi:ribosomal protein S18 acetylase RimI-like enzyme
MTKFANYSSDGRHSPRLTEADGLVLRVSAPHDLTSIAEISAEREEKSVAECRDELERMQEGIRAGRAQLFVGDLAGTVIGFGKVAHFSPPVGAPAGTAPGGWYLAGVIVRPNQRRRGIGRALTLARLEWIATRSEKAYYFANEMNRASIDLHAAVGFTELTRDFRHPGAEFSGGRGILFECDLRKPTEAGQGRPKSTKVERSRR